MMDLPTRKPTRLKEYDYSAPGAYFITLCVKNRKELLSQIIIGDDDRVLPQNQLSYIGLICDKYINSINVKYENATVDKYVIMPNHIHMIILIHEKSNIPEGTMRVSSNIENIIRSFKILVTKEIGNSIWQRSYHDHIIRGERDYRKIWEYIDTNAVKWEEDCFYNGKTDL